MEVRSQGRSGRRARKGGLWVRLGERAISAVTFHFGAADTNGNERNGASIDKNAKRRSARGCAQITGKKACDVSCAGVTVGGPLLITNLERRPAAAPARHTEEINSLRYAFCGPALEDAQRERIECTRLDWPSVRRPLHRRRRLLASVRGGRRRRVYSLPAKAVCAGGGGAEEVRERAARLTGNPATVTARLMFAVSARGVTRLLYAGSAPHASPPGAPYWLYPADGGGAA